jgi:hypothetical protein
MLAQQCSEFAKGTLMACKWLEVHHSQCVVWHMHAVHTGFRGVFTVCLVLWVAHLQQSSTRATCSKNRSMMLPLLHARLRGKPPGGQHCCCFAPSALVCCCDRQLVCRHLLRRCEFGSALCFIFFWYQQQCIGASATDC